MNLDDKILIPICKNHFERLAKNDVCIACPSKLENKEILEAIADLYKEDKDKVLKAILTEIASLRRLTAEQQEQLDKIGNIEHELGTLKTITIDQKEQLDKIEILEKTITSNQQTLFGINGQNGLYGDNKNIKDKIYKLEKYLWIAIGGLGVINIGMAVILKLF